MPTPVAHSLAGACAALLAARRIPRVSALPVVAAVLFAANLPDVDYLALVRGREAMERFHQGPLHSIAFVALATGPLALLLRRRLGMPLAWALLAGAGMSHLLLDLIGVDRQPPVGFPLLWPFTARLFHGPVEIFPGIDRAAVFSARNLLELLVELAWGVPALLLAGWRPSLSALNALLPARFSPRRAQGSPTRQSP